MKFVKGEQSSETEAAQKRTKEKRASKQKETKKEKRKKKVLQTDALGIANRCIGDEEEKRQTINFLGGQVQKRRKAQERRKAQKRRRKGRKEGVEPKNQMRKWRWKAMFEGVQNKKGVVILPLPQGQ